MKLLRICLFLIISLFSLFHTSEVHAQAVCCDADSTCTAYGPLLRCLGSIAGYTGRCDANPGAYGSGAGYCAEPPPSPDTPRFYIPDYYAIVGNQFKFSSLSGLSGIGAVVSALLPYVYVVAGLLLFVYLIYGGFHLLTSFGSPKAILEAWLIVFRALVGFIMIFMSFWLIRLVEIMFAMEII